MGTLQIPRMKTIGHPEGSRQNGRHDFGPFTDDTRVTLTNQRGAYEIRVVLIMNSQNPAFTDQKGSFGKLPLIIG
jgi:hypothetical protein